MSDAVVDVAFHTPVSGADRAVVEITVPPTQDLIQPIPNVLPTSDIPRLQNGSNLGFQTLNTPLGGTGSQIPMTVAVIPVRAKRVAEKIKPFRPGIAYVRFALIQTQLQLLHDRPRPLHGLRGVTTTEDHEVIRIVHDGSSEDFA